MCLNAGQWAVVAMLSTIWFVFAPTVWKNHEPFSTGPDYRIPYSLSKDYWLYERRLQHLSDRSRIPILGDSVVWGEYVRPDGTLSHFLNEQIGQPGRFVNCGVNGLFPLAMEGLVRHFGGELHDRQVIVHCNVLWMSSPQADLSSDKEQRFNHAGLVPQLAVRIPSYRADAATRLSAAISQRVLFFAWSDHLQIAYYDQRSTPQWTLEEEEGDPRKLPNAWRNPLAPIRSGIPVEPATDPQRGPSSPRHKPWSAAGAEPVQFDWVDLDSSLQWQAFQRAVLLLRSRGNEVIVILGPFNQHMIEPDQQPMYRSIRDRIVLWLDHNHFSVIAPPPLPSTLYADASHPLTDGYSQLSHDLLDDSAFDHWIHGSPSAK